MSRIYLLKVSVSLLFPIIFVFAGYCSILKNDKIMEMIEKIQWFGQATIKINIGNKTVYIDPYQLKSTDTADIILITHKHHDHLSLPDIKKILDPETQIIAPKDCIESIKETGANNIFDIEPGQSLEIEGIKIEAVYAYNIIKKSFHPKSNNFLGYLLTIDGVTIYHAGDTERIPEMKDINCDIILIPLGQTYTMNNVEEAVEAVKDTKAKIAIPIHYGTFEGTKEDALKFKELLKNDVEVVIKENE